MRGSGPGGGGLALPQGGAAELGAAGAGARQRRTDWAASARGTATAGAPGRAGCCGALVLHAAWGATTVSGAPTWTHPARMSVATAGSVQAALIAAREPGGTTVASLPGCGAALHRVQTVPSVRGVH